MQNLVQQLINECEMQGIQEFCICAGARNAPLVYALAQCSHFKIYYWFEERSAAFFALGRARATHRPVAVITTSGTACGELLPASMEAHYTHTPLLFITADRPRRFRGTGAPQSAEQLNLFGCYVEFCLDIEVQEPFDLNLWKKDRPAHINVCFEEPQGMDLKNMSISSSGITTNPHIKKFPLPSIQEFSEFIKKSNYPLVLLGAIPSAAHETLVPFLVSLNLPIYAEAISGLRENREISHLRINCIDEAWKLAEKSGYPIDGVLRIGSVPTARLWRDLDEKRKHLPVLSISELPFSGLSRAGIMHACIKAFSEQAIKLHRYDDCHWKKWQQSDRLHYEQVLKFVDEEPLAELSLMHRLSKTIPHESRVYLGNSMPIREWDFISTYENRNIEIGASRGLNGIDGQISTFLGWCKKDSSNWAVLGDLTTLYDMAGPWILPQIPEIRANIVVINNGGGKIFTKLFSEPIFYNCHQLEFSHLAGLWGLPYTKWNKHSMDQPIERSQFIEIVPEEAATIRLNEKIKRSFDF